jgi:competence ComEA-like helix-hairpin-helix protein
MDENGLRCRCVWPGAVIPVQPINDDADGRITEAEEILSPRAPAAAFLIGGESEDEIIQNLQKIQKTDLPELWVRLRGDFVIEDTGKRRAIDAEFVRAELPTGDRPKGSEHGIQGGLFESWFTVVARRVDINRATPEELEALPGIGRELAGDIITGRPFSTIDELLKVPGIGTATMKKLRPLVTIG